jgi:acyl carrier protein
MAQPLELEPKLRAIFRKVLNARCPEISDAFGDMEGWDSLAHIDLISAVEEEFSIAINIQEVQKLRTYEDFSSLVTAKLN